MFAAYLAMTGDERREAARGSPAWRTFLAGGELDSADASEALAADLAGAAHEAVQDGFDSHGVSGYEL